MYLQGIFVQIPLNPHILSISDSICLRVSPKDDVPLKIFVSSVSQTRFILIPSRLLTSIRYVNGLNKSCLTKVNHPPHVCFQTGIGARPTFVTKSIFCVSITIHCSA